MKPETSPEQITPWYRQFWPWFIILLPASVVVAGLSTLVIAIKHADTLVVDDYYKEGLAINQQLEKQQRAVDLGISGKLLIDNTVGDVVVTLVSAPAYLSPTLQLRLGHPTDASQDVLITLTAGVGGVYRGQLEHSLAGHRYLQLDDPQHGWRLKALYDTASNQAVVLKATES